MNTRMLRTGIPISEIGLGCWAIGEAFAGRTAIVEEIDDALRPTT